MYETMIFCSPKTGSTVFGRWLTELGNIDFKEVYASSFDFEVLEVPNKGEAKTNEYIALTGERFSFQQKHAKLENYFQTIRRPAKVSYKMFLSWSHDFSKETFYKNYIRDRNNVLLLRKDFADWTSSLLLQRDGVCLRDIEENATVSLKLDRRFFSDTIKYFYTFLDTVDRLNAIVIYEDAIRDKTCDPELYSFFGIKQNFDKHIAVIDNPLEQKEKHISNFAEFNEFVKPYEIEYNSVLNKIKNKYVTQSHTQLIGKL